MAALTTFGARAVLEHLPAIGDLLLFGHKECSTSTLTRSSHTAWSPASSDATRVFSSVDTSMSAVGSNVRVTMVGATPGRARGALPTVGSDAPVLLPASRLSLHPSAQIAKIAKSSTLRPTAAEQYLTGYVTTNLVSTSGSSPRWNHHGWAGSRQPVSIP
jgi:hypothetical protein